jgi:hypothetical protein
LRADFGGHVLAQSPDVEGCVQQVLGLTDAERGVDGDPFSDADGGIDVCAFGGEVGDESDLECPLSIERFCRVEHFGGVGETDQPRQPPGGADVATGEPAGEHCRELRNYSETLRQSSLLYIRELRCHTIDSSCLHDLM